MRPGDAPARWRLPPRYWAAMPAARTTSKSPSRILLGGALLIASALAAGCGQKVVDDQKLEAQIKANLEGRTGVRIASVSCPTGVDVDPGHRFDCVARAQDGRQARVRVLIRDKDADVTIVAVSATR
jgi:Domain of unknown function (DUF4333)